MAKKNHYVDVKEFLEAFERYLPIVRPLREKYEKECKKLLAKGIPEEDLPPFERPRNEDYEIIGKNILKIAENYAHKLSFSDYTFKEEMIGDAIENSIRYLENFDPAISKNPFAYFTQITKWAFYRRIAAEELHSYVKRKLLKTEVSGFTTQDGDSGKYSNSYVDFFKEINDDIIVEFEKKKQEKKQKSKKNKKEKKVIDKFEKFMVEV